MGSKIVIAPSHLGNVFSRLIADKDGVVNTVTVSQLARLQQPPAYGPLEKNIPVYVFVPVTLGDLEQTEIYLGFVNNGAVPFSPGEDLSQYLLTDRKYYTSLVANSQLWHGKEPLIFDKTGPAPEQVVYSYLDIFEDFWLTGAGELAGFVGIFLVDSNE